ncbi:MAG: hypothetical protein R3B47_12475 [Bacteroidia bacterium]
MWNKRSSSFIISGWTCRACRPGPSAFGSRFNQATSQNGSATDLPLAPVRGNFTNMNDPQEEVLGFF